MSCLLAALALITPRLVIVLVWLFSNAFSVAYATVIWPVLGFVFMPYTTLAYLGAMLYNGHRLSGVWLLLFVLAVLADLGSDERAWHSGRSKARAKSREAS